MRRLSVLAPLAALAALGTLAAAPAGAAAHGTTDQITFARQLPGGGADIFITSPDGSNASTAAATALSFSVSGSIPEL